MKNTVSALVVMTLISTISGFVFAQDYYATQQYQQHQQPQLQITRGNQPIYSNNPMNTPQPQRNQPIQQPQLQPQVPQYYTQDYRDQYRQDYYAYNDRSDRYDDHFDRRDDRNYGYDDHHMNGYHRHHHDERRIIYLQPAYVPVYSRPVIYSAPVPRVLVEPSVSFQFHL